jgi:hypothetical protein
MTTTNKTITNAFTVIRGNNNFIIFCLPNFFDLDAYFKKFRTRGLIYVSHKKYFAFYNPNDIIRLLKEYKKSENPISPFSKIRPTYPREAFPKYEGILLEEYKKRKAAKIERAKKELMGDFVENESEDSYKLDIDRLTSRFTNMAN